MNILKKNFFAAFILLITFLLPGQIYGANGSINGTITDSNGNPLAGASVYLGLNQVDVYTTVTASDGTYSIPSIVQATYGIKVFLTNYRTQISTISVSNNNSTQLNFSLTASTSTVSGTVYSNSTGLPIPNANINFFYAESHLVSGFVADSNGFYTTDSLAPGTYTIRAFLSGYQVGGIGLNVVVGQDYSGQDIYLDVDPGTISGTVSKSGGGVITSGLVNFYMDGAVVQATQLTGSGNYSESNLAVGTYTVVASSANYETKTASATVTSGGTTTLNIELDSLPGSVSGTVTDADGAIVEGVRIDVFDNNVSIGQGITDNTGVYSITGLAAGSYTLKVQKVNYLLITKSISISNNALSTVDVEITFNPDAQTNGIIGTVTDAATGLPIPGAIVSTKIGSQLTLLTLSGINGAYAFYDLQPGSYTITAGATDYETAIASVTVVTMQNVQQDFTLGGSPGSVTGKITDTGLTGIDFATVNLVQGGHLVATTFTDASGDYTIAGAAPGDYSVQASKTGYQTNIDESVVITAGGTATADLSLTSIPDTVVGVITSSATGDPIPAAIVQLNPSTGTLLNTMFTSVTGTFDFGGVAGGTYTVSANAPNYFAKTSASFSVTSDGASEEITVNITLNPLDFSPQNVVGSVVVNSFLLQDDRVHRLTWFASSVPTVESYRIQRNGVIIANITADQQYFVYDDHNRSPLQLDGYVITAINDNGDESASSTIMLQ